MTENAGGKRSFKQILGGWFYGILFKPGWPRWAMLAVVAVLFMLAALGLTGGTDYREDPSALVPRSAQSYVETNNLDHLLRNVGAWRLWDEKRRRPNTEQYNQLHVDIAGLLGERVQGLGTRLISILASTARAAYCVNQDEQGGESWALFMQLEDPNSILNDLAVEQNMNLEVVEGTKDNGVLKLTGSGDGELYFGVVKPWLIISSADILPKFALGSARRPTHSMANSGILPKWKRGNSLRGVYNPAFHADKTNLSAYSIITGWMAPEMRINFTSSFRNGLETTFNAGMLSEKARGGGLWPLFWVLLLLLALICLVLAFVIILVMVGWGGWLKTTAMRAGISPAKEPGAVDPSEAFKEDAGIAVQHEAKSVQTEAGEGTAELSDVRDDSSTKTGEGTPKEGSGSEMTTPSSAISSPSDEANTAGLPATADGTTESGQGQSASGINPATDATLSDKSDDEETSTNSSM